MMPSPIKFLCTVIILPGIASAFLVPSSVGQTRLARTNTNTKHAISMSINPSDEDQKDEANNELNIKYEDVTGFDDETMETLQIRITRLRLEEENTRKMLKSRPRKFPYEECKKWAQAQNMFHSEEEWFEYINRGENLCVYIPSDPETYFRNQGTWISWEDFLGC